jgi:hypothetical protein
MEPKALRALPATPVKTASKDHPALPEANRTAPRANKALPANPAKTAPLVRRAMLVLKARPVQPALQDPPAIAVRKARPVRRVRNKARRVRPDLPDPKDPKDPRDPKEAPVVPVKTANIVRVPSVGRVWSRRGRVGPKLRPRLKKESESFFVEFGFAVLLLLPRLS